MCFNLKFIFRNSSTTEIALRHQFIRRFMIQRVVAAPIVLIPGRLQASWLLATRLGGSFCTETRRQEEYIPLFGAGIAIRHTSCETVVCSSTHRFISMLQSPCWLQIQDLQPSTTYQARFGGDRYKRPVKPSLFRSSSYFATTENGSFGANTCTRRARYNPPRLHKSEGWVSRSHSNLNMPASVACY